MERKLEGLKVLLVDDEAGQLALWKKDLKALPVRVFATTSTSEAIEIAKAERPDVALLDFSLVGYPIENGFMLAQAVRPMLVDLYIHITSSYVSAVTFKLAIRHGIDDMSRKPINAAQVVMDACGAPVNIQKLPLSTLDEVDAFHIARALLHFDNNLSRTAEVLGLTTPRLRRRIKQLKIIVPTRSRGRPKLPAHGDVCSSTSEEARNEVDGGRGQPDDERRPQPRRAELGAERE
jgi:ActR/RegA family two-component response regulator